MNADVEEQEDELLALNSIFGSEEFVRDESKTAGEIRVCVELPADFTVALKEGETLSQYEISFLPPLLLTFELPQDYPSSSPPSFSLTCTWLTSTQLSALAAELTDLYQATGGAVVLFTWIQFLKEDALRFLNIQTLLELPLDENSTQNCSQDSSHAALSEPKSKQHTAGSGRTDNQSCDVSDPRESDLSAPSLEVEHPIEILAEGQNPSISGRCCTDSPVADQKDSTSHHGVVSQNSPNLGPKADYQKTCDDSNQTAQASDGREAAQTSGDYQGDQSKPLLFAQSNQGGQEDFLNDSEQGAASLPIHPRESSHNENQTLSGLKLTPSQALLSQLLIYDAAQQQKQFASSVFDCGVCFTGWLGSDCVQLPECGHIFCRACLAQLCELQIKEGNVRSVTCPQADCTATPTPAQVKSLVGEELFGRYDRLLLQNTLDCMADVVYCPRRPCGSVVIREKSGTAAMCSVCGFAFCVACRKTYHGTEDCQGEKNVTKRTDKDTDPAGVDLPQSQEGMKALWDDYASGSKQRQHLLEGRYGRKVLRVTVEDYLSEDWMVFNSKNCPHCFCRIQKDRGCNMMMCSQCRRQFCWACLTKLSTPHIGAHFQDSPCALYQYFPT